MNPISTGGKRISLLLRALWIVALLAGAAACDSPRPTPAPKPATQRVATNTPSPTPPMGGIEGRVYNNLSATRAPAANAEIRISEKPEVLVAADANGSFLLDNIEPSAYHLRASNTVGSSTEKLVAVVIGKVTYLEIDILQPVIIRLLLVRVTITCNSRPAAGAQMWVAGTNQVFTANDQGVVTLNNVPEQNAMVAIVASPCSAILNAPSGLDWQIKLTTAPRLLPLPPKHVIQPPNIKLETIKPMPFLPFVPVPTSTPH